MKALLPSRLLHQDACFSTLPCLPLLKRCVACPGLPLLPLLSDLHIYPSNSLQDRGLLSVAGSLPSLFICASHHRPTNAFNC